MLIFSKVFGDLFLPAQKIFSGKNKSITTKLTDRWIYHLLPHNLSTQNFKIKMNHAINIDGIIIKPTNNQFNNNQSIYIINVVGYSSCYELQIPKMIASSQRIGAINIGFNYPNVMHSKGTINSRDTLINSLIAVINYFVALGVSYEQICLDGHSMGGGIALLAAANLKIQNDINLKVIVDRSFTNFRTAIVENYALSPYKRASTGSLMFLPIFAILAIVLPLFKKKRLIKQTLSGFFITPLISIFLPNVWKKYFHCIMWIILKTLNWEIDNVQSINKLNKKYLYSVYLNQLSPKLPHQIDKIIPDTASLKNGNMYEVDKNAANKYRNIYAHSCYRLLLFSDQINTNAQDKIDSFILHKVPNKLINNI